MSFRRFQFFFPDTALFCFFLAAPENSTTECFQNSLPGTPYHHRTGSPAVSPDEPKLELLKPFRRPASWHCATADYGLSRLRWPSSASSSTTRTSLASRLRALHP